MSIIYHNINFELKPILSKWVIDIPLIKRMANVFVFMLDNKTAVLQQMINDVSVLRAINRGQNFRALLRFLEFE
jgi:hypothetical protein